MKALETLIFAEISTIFRDVTFYGPVAFDHGRRKKIKVGHAIIKNENSYSHCNSFIPQDIKTNIRRIEIGYCVCSLSQSLSEISLA